MNTSIQLPISAPAAAPRATAPKANRAAANGPDASQNNSFASMMKHAHSADKSSAPSHSAAAKSTEAKSETASSVRKSETTKSTSDAQGSSSADGAKDADGSQSQDVLSDAQQQEPGADGKDGKGIDSKSHLKVHADGSTTKLSAHKKADTSEDAVPAQAAQAGVVDGQLAQVTPTELPLAVVPKTTESGASNSDGKASIAQLAMAKGTGPKAVVPGADGKQAPVASAPQDAAKIAEKTSDSAGDDDAQEEQASDDVSSPFAEKLVNAAAAQHSHLLNADTVTPAASSDSSSFRFSLQQVAQPSHAITHNTVRDAVQASAAANDRNAAPEIMPAVRHLEVAMNDPLLGNVGVRAEMRNGTLHASISGAVGDIATAAPALHQYLQQHNVELHSVSFTAPTTNDTRVPQVNAAATASFGSGMDSSSSNGSGAQPQQQSARTAVPEWKSAFADNSDYNVNGFMNSRVPAAALSSMRAGSTLSIHI